MYGTGKLLLLLFFVIILFQANNRLRRTRILFVSCRKRSGSQTTQHLRSDNDIYYLLQIMDLNTNVRRVGAVCWLARCLIFSNFNPTQLGD